MGIGSKLKRAVRKIIPNELAEVAVTAAPFVAPFNPAIAAAMAGLGSFDQTGRIGSSVRAGLGTYALGQGARYLGGAGFQGNPFASGGAFTGQGFTGGFSSPFGTETGIGSLFKSEAPLTDVPSRPTIADVSGPGSMPAAGPNLPADMAQAIPRDIPSLPGADAVGESLAENTLKATGSSLKEFMKASVKDKGKMALKFFNSLDGKTKLALGVGSVSAALQYLENKGAEKERSDFALFRDRPTDFYNLQYRGGQQAKDGGIIGFADGGEPAMEMDYRGGGFIPVGAKERADDVPARLSKNEFVMTAAAVRAAGGGSVDVGAQRMYDLMNRLEAQA